MIFTSDGHCSVSEYKIRGGYEWKEQELTEDFREGEQFAEKRVYRKEFMEWTGIRVLMGSTVKAI